MAYVYLFLTSISSIFITYVVMTMSINMIAFTINDTVFLVAQIFAEIVTKCWILIYVRSQFRCNITCASGDKHWNSLCESSGQRVAT